MRRVRHGDERYGRAGGRAERRWDIARGKRWKKPANRYALVAERVHDLSRSPGDAQREAMWNVEVPEAFKALEAAHDGGG